LAPREAAVLGGRRADEEDGSMSTRDTGGQSQSGKSRRDDELDDVPAPEANPEVAERHEQLTEDVDDLLDEIDSVLEENAEEFVRGYVQKGGQ
jgi:prokaryotic ubiquitin-like protein Pup